MIFRRNRYEDFRGWNSRHIWNTFFLNWNLIYYKLIAKQFLRIIDSKVYGELKDVDIQR